MNANSDTKEGRRSKEPLPTSELSNIEREGLLTCSRTPQDSGVENGQNSRASTAQKLTSLELESTTRLTDTEAPSVQEVHIFSISVILFFYSIYDIVL